MEHLVIFINYDGKELCKTTVADGGAAVYSGETPRKPGENFLGWNKPIDNVKDDIVVTAVFGKSKEGSLNLAAISFVEEGKEMNVIDNAVISNEDLYQTKENELEK